MKDWWNEFRKKITETPFRNLLEEAWVRLKDLRPVRAIMIVGFLIIIFVVGNQGCEATRRVKELSNMNVDLMSSREAILLMGDIISSFMVLEGNMQSYALDLQNTSRDIQPLEEKGQPSAPVTPKMYNAMIEQKLTKLSLLGGSWTEQDLKKFATRARAELELLTKLGDDLDRTNRNLSRYAKLDPTNPEERVVRDSIARIVSRQVSEIRIANLRSATELISLNNAYLQLRADWGKTIDKSEDRNISLVHQMEIQTVLVSLLLVMLFLMMLVVIFNDLNRNRILQKRLEKEKLNAQTLAEVKQRFLANMSHEIRNPLHAIIGFAEQLAQTELARNQRHLLKPLQRSARYLLALINDVLDFSKIDSQNLVLDKTGFSLRDVFEEVDSTFASQASKKGIEFHTSFDETLPEVVLGDSLRLKQMLLNLVGNALKFTEQGSVTFSVAAEVRDPHAVKVRFEVKDTGIGIPVHLQQQIFSEWTQADSQTTRRYGGTGLGLAITTKLAELHRGQLTMESEEGKGTSIQLLIPYECGTLQDLETGNGQAGQELSRSWKGKKVLVADDEPFNRTLVEILLEKMDIEPDSVENGQLAWEKLQEQAYDLVLLDLQMPEMDGFEVARKAREALGEELPLIAVTATATRNESNKAQEAGMNEILLKPFEEKDLIRVLSRYFVDSDEETP